MVVVSEEVKHVLERALLTGQPVGTARAEDHKRPAKPSSNLLLQIQTALQELADAQTIWYATTEYCREGTIYKLPLSGTNPECYIFHPIMLDRFLAEVPTFMKARHIQERHPRLNAPDWRLAIEDPYDVRVPARGKVNGEENE